MAFGATKPYQANDRQSFLPAWGRWSFAIVLFLLAGAIVGAGMGAIRRHHFELDWRSGTPVEAARGIKTFDGPQAVLLGCSLMSFGGMLAVWGAALIMSFMRNDSTEGDSRLGRVLTWASLGFLLAAILCLFPSWRLQSILFYAVVALVDGFLLTVPDSSHQRWARRIFPLLVTAMVVAASLDIEAGASMGIGLFAAIGILAHLLMLFPRLKERFLAESTPAR